MVRPRFLYLQRANSQRSDAGPLTAWRLIGANNRELGRSAAWHDDQETCDAAIARLVAGIESVTCQVSTNSVDGTWTWRVDLDGQPAANAARCYLRQRECRFNYQQFLAAVPVARIAGARDRQHLVIAGPAGHRPPTAPVACTLARVDETART